MPWPSAQIEKKMFKIVLPITHDDMVSIVPLRSKIKYKFINRGGISYLNPFCLSKMKVIG